MAPPPATAFDANDMLIDPRLFVMPTEWVDKSKRSNCLVCAREFNPVWRKKHTCRMCGDVVCGRCSVHKRVDLPLKDNLFRICTWCFLRVRQPVAQAIPVDPATVSASTLVHAAAAPSTPVSADEPDDADDDRSGCGAYSYLHSSHSSILSTQSSRALTIDMTDDDDDIIADILDAGPIDMSEIFDVAVVDDDFVDPNLELLKAREAELEAEVQRCRAKFDQLEATIHATELAANLTQQQKTELDEARALIRELQQRLREKEEEHLTTRMTIHEDMHRARRESMSSRPAHLIQHLLVPSSPPKEVISPAPIVAAAPTDGDLSEAASLRRQLAKMARQMQQAGLNVAEDIPYAEAKRRVDAVSQRMHEIGSSEVVHEDKAEQAALRKEYYELEKEMEKYSTALMMTDEYVQEQAAAARAWDAAQAAANDAALATVRRCVPVDVAVLSEKQLATQLGAPALARKLKRTNVLQLVRVAPATIQRMHPSIVEGYRLAGLGLIERRALHVVLAAPAAEWKKQSKDEFATRKYTWFKKLHKALVDAIESYDRHHPGSKDASHVCSARHACPVLIEAKVDQLYAVDLGCPPDAQYVVHDVVKSDSGQSSSSGGGASDAELAVAQKRTQARHASVKAHYQALGGGGQVLLVTQAMGAMDNMDAALLALARGEAALVTLQDKDKERLAALVLTARDAVVAMAKRSGICVTGKRDTAKDSADGRAPVEATVAQELTEYIEKMRDEMEEYMLCVDPVHKSVALLQSLQTLLPDVAARNRAKMVGMGKVPPRHSRGRTPWKDIVKEEAAKKAASPANHEISSIHPRKAAGGKPNFFDELQKAKKPPGNFLDELKKKKAAPNAMLAMIKARRATKVEDDEEGTAAVVESSPAMANTA
ncbi:Aste57867_18997 [Aphanomyces stellatus]|uniref:Aste57867_18997 protein n=1 Tax=Aphanomyces stellatus TaxID=120398 RepID=A0A485LD02_9STRA|nr:hypothetical protein As57867_018933 [Aphanomyces stellatus]VFT95723.1 Aste57867_18997 [Aphanomyces stellatus]